jgi:quinol monooxygenase YgiN
LIYKQTIKNKEKTVQEPGCEIFVVQQSRENPYIFILWEKFISQDAFKKHHEYEHTQHYFSLELTEVVQLFPTDII